MGKKSIIRLIKRAVKLPYVYTKESLADMNAAKYIKKNLEKKIGKKVKVGFIVQMPAVWDKEVDVYNEMKKRDNIETFLLVVPPYDFANKKFNFSYENNYFIENYPEAIKAIDPSGKVIDIKKLGLDYLFFQRQYDHYLPPELSSIELVKDIKCCYIPYGYSGSDVFNPGNTDPIFFRNMSYVFVESDYIKYVFEEKYRKKRMYKYQHIKSLGYPDLEQFFDESEVGMVKKIMWTPRWYYDKKLGGSHFFENKDDIFKIKEENLDIELVFRPHPLMFEQFINQGLMTADEEEAFKSKIREASIKYDSDSMISNAIHENDLLITDYSSIIINFFLTGKPIIYCKANYDLNDDYSRMAEGIYVAENSEQLSQYVKMLINGKDPLKEKRAEIISEYKKKHVGSAKRIVDCLTAAKNK